MTAKKSPYGSSKYKITKSEWDMLNEFFVTIDRPLGQGRDRLDPFNRHESSPLCRVRTGSPRSEPIALPVRRVGRSDRRRARR